MDQVYGFVAKSHGNPDRDLWIKIPLDNQTLRRFWGQEKQPSIESLISKVASIFTEWLEEGNDNRSGTGPEEIPYR